MSGYIADGPRFWLERSVGEGGVPLRAQRIAPVVTFVVDMAAVALLAVAAIRTWRLRRFVPIPTWSWSLVGVAFSSWFVYSLVIWLSDATAIGRHFWPIVVLGSFAFLAVALLWPNGEGVKPSKKLSHRP